MDDEPVNQYATHAYLHERQLETHCSLRVFPLLNEYQSKFIELIAQIEYESLYSGY